MSVALQTQRSPLGELLRLALPTVAQMASYTVMQFVGTQMLSRVSLEDPTAAGLSQIMSFSIISLAMGAIMVVNTLASQSYGRGHFHVCGQWMWQGIWFSFLYAGVVFAVLPFLSHLFEIFGHAPSLAGRETTYMQIVLSATLFKLIATAMGQFLLAINRPSAVLVSAVIGVSANIFVAWVLILGKLGFHPIGIRGAAWAQNVGVFVEMLVLLFMLLRPEVRHTYRLSQWRPRAGQMRLLVTLGVPAGVQLAADVLAWALFLIWVIAIFGTQAMAANTFMFRYMSVSFMPAYGIAQAVTALVGRYIGRNDHDAAAHRAALGFKVCAVYMLFCAIGYIAFRRPLMHLFTDDPEVIRIGAMLLIFAAAYQFFDAMYIVYNGALRGAGDTFVPAVMTAVLCWGITVLGGLMVSRFFTHIGPAGPWIAASAYGVILGLFMLLRFRAGRWRTIRLDEQGHSR